MKFIYTILTTIRGFISGLVSLVLVWMLVLSLLQLLLRWIFEIGFTWAGIQLQQMVLMIALLGGVVAATDNRHIRIDLLEQYLKGKPRLIVRHLISAIAGIGSIYLGYLSIKFIQFERDTGSELRDFLFGKTMPNWYIELIIPVSFILMGLVFILKSIIPDQQSRGRTGNKA